MLEFKIAKPGTQYNGIHIPAGCVYGILPECVRNGAHMLRAFVWVPDTSLALKQRHFCVNIISANSRRVRKIYVDGSKGWAKCLQNYIRFHCVESVGGVCLRRDIAKLAPHDRKVGKYYLRPVPGEDDSPTANRTKVSESVINPCNISGRLLRQESYYVLRMGMK